MIPRCMTCKHWSPDLDAVGARALGGHCLNETKLSDGCGKYLPDGLEYDYSEGGGFWTGPEFGCIHHETEGSEPK